MKGREALETGLQQALRRATGDASRVRLEGGPVGGAINRTMTLRHGGQRYFLKLNSPERLHMFEAEREGLLEISATNSLRVPMPVCAGTTDVHAFLVLEYLELQGAGDQQALGAGLATMHRWKAARYGWHRDNTIGLTPQHNEPLDDWAVFWRERRLRYQLDLAVAHGYARDLEAPGLRLLEGVADLLQGHDPAPSLLHGDLWSGNKGFLPNGRPVVFDPAAYHGDRETDLAMCALFGGFGADFWDSYQDRFPPTAGQATRRDLYQLYHVLNHLNLFGGAYLVQAQRMIERLLAELG